MRAICGWRFWLRVALPIAIGVAAALWSLNGDTGPDAAPFQPTYFASTNRCLVGARWVDCPSPESSQPTEFTATYVIAQDDTYDPKLDFFTLKSPHGSFLLMLDRDLPAAAFLRRHDHERIALTLTAAQ